MTNPIASSVGNSAKTLAQQIAKQMAREPLEILTNAREQTTGETFSEQLGNQTTRQPEDQQKVIHEQQALQDKMKSNRLIEALNRELDDIHKQKVFKELQERIMNGEVVPLEEYTELTMDQKQVLNAQMEAVKNQRAIQSTNQNVGVPAINSKPSRRFGAGQKQQAQKEQTRVEKPVNNSS